MRQQHVSAESYESVRWGGKHAFAALDGWTNKAGIGFEWAGVCSGKVKTKSHGCGWWGALTTTQAKEHWQRFTCSLDNHFGSSNHNFTKLRWRGSWKRRQTQGWSAAAICTWWKCEKHEWICIARDREAFAEWWTCHQP